VAARPGTSAFKISETNDINLMSADFIEEHEIIVISRVALKKIVRSPDRLPIMREVPPLAQFAVQVDSFRIFPLTAGISKQLAMESVSSPISCPDPKLRPSESCCAKEGAAGDLS
jgi:hypothetical protein